MTGTLDIIIAGAGPAGLAAAIAAKKRGLTYRVFEKGSLVNSLLHYPAGMVFFTTPELMEVGGLPFVSPHDKPTRAEALRYYRRVAETYALDIAFDTPVSTIGRDGGAFVVTTAGRQAATTRARFLLMATGAYDFPNRLGVPGEDLPHVSHYYGESFPWYRKHVVIVGGKNSAAETALDLFRNGARVTLVHRQAALGDGIKYWVKPDIENRLAEGSVRALFNATIEAITPTDVTVRTPGGTETMPADGVFLLTGYRADNQLLASAGVEILNNGEYPRHDAGSYETNVPGLFLAGAVIAGRQSGRIFIENGRFHGEQVIQTVATRLAAMPASVGSP
ncbi:MAG: YpdA family putative bacillithiol disulfide reductase [Acidobacteriota bacterium]|nr:YpdA family putative bacillithiol disulfide reductase [Acidobacteriota bacterium]